MRSIRTRRSVAIARAALALLFLLLGSGCGALTAQFENDLFTDTDRHYTNGMRLSWLSEERPSTGAPGVVTRALDAVARTEEADNVEVRYGWAVGHSMYTPEDGTRKDLILDDRPYAGWLYGGVSRHTITSHPGERRDLESVEIDIGVVGPMSLAQDGQDLIHEIRGFDKFQGWDNQLENELGVLLLYERKWRLFDPITVGSLEFDAIPHIGASAGNIQVHLGAGGAVRWGLRLPRNFGPPALIQGSDSLQQTRPPCHGLWGCSSFYAFVTAEGRAVVHSIFLDGNTWRDSHSVDRETLVTDLTYGVALLLGRFDLAYASVLRSREFEGQDNTSRFGALTASVRF